MIVYGLLRVSGRAIHEMRLAVTRSRSSRMESGMFHAAISRRVRRRHTGIYLKTSSFVTRMARWGTTALTRCAASIQQRHTTCVPSPLTVGRVDSSDWRHVSAVLSRSFNRVHKLARFGCLYSGESRARETKRLETFQKSTAEFENLSVMERGEA